MVTAFQKNAFQNKAFQIDVPKDFVARYGPSFYIDNVLMRREDSPPKNNGG